MNDIKDIYSCPIEIIKGLTDKEQIQYLTKLKGASRGDFPLYNTIYFTKIKVKIYHYLPYPFMGPLYGPCKEVIIASL